MAPSTLGGEGAVSGMLELAIFSAQYLITQLMQLV